MDFGKIGQAVGNFVDNAVDAAKDVVDGAKDAVQDAAKGMTQVAQDTMNDVMADPVKAMIPPGAAAELVDNTLEQLGVAAEYRGLAKAAMNPVGEALDYVNGKDSVTDSVAKGVNKAGEVGGEALKIVGGTVIDAGNLAIAVGSEAGKTAAETIAVVDKGTKQVIEGLFDKLKEGVNRVDLPGGPQIAIDVVGGKPGKIAVINQDIAAIIAKLIEAINRGPDRTIMPVPMPGDGGIAPPPSGSTGPIGGGPPTGEITPPGPESPSASGKYDDLLDKASGITTEIGTIQEEIAGLDASDPEFQTKMFQLQNLMQTRQQIFTLISNLMKSEHDAAMAVINNIRS